MQNNRRGEIDLSMMPQEEISPSRPYVQGEIAPTPPLAMPTHFGRPSRFTRAVRQFFFGDTQPGTDRGRTHAFKRGLMLAGGLGVLVAGIIAIVFLAKGVAFFSLVLPLAALVVACLVIAGALMCCYHCVARFRGRHTVAHYRQVERTVSYELPATLDADLPPTPGPWDYAGQTRPPGFPPVAPPVPAQQFGAQPYPQYSSGQHLPQTDPAVELRQFSSSTYSVYGDSQQPPTGVTRPGQNPRATAPVEDVTEEYDSNTKKTAQFG